MTALLSPQTPAAELARLAYSPEVGVRCQVAAHPNTPAEVLGGLAREFPAEVLHNPALPLLRLAAPNMVSLWPARALEAMSALPDAPDWLLRMAAKHPVIDVQLACVTQPQLPNDVLAQLAASPFWTIREYVARKPDLPATLLERLSHDRDYGVRITLAGRADLSDSLRAHLQQDAHPLVRAVLHLQNEGLGDADAN